MGEQTIAVQGFTALLFWDSVVKLKTYLASMQVQLFTSFTFIDKCNTASESFFFCLIIIHKNA